MAGKGGGAWKVAYADFVTAMMAFFLVMWITSQGQDVKEAIATHFREPLEPLVPGDGYPPEHVGASNAKGRERRTSWTPSDNADTEKRQKARGVVIRRGEDSGAGTVIYFGDDSVELDESAIRRLQLLVPQVIGKPHLLEIRGHASRRPLPRNGSYHDAWDMSYERCLATMAFLADEGIPPERLRLSQTAGYEPDATADDAARLSSAPRVEIIVLGEMLETVGQAADEAPSPPEEAPHQDALPERLPQRSS